MERNFVKNLIENTLREGGNNGSDSATAPGDSSDIEGIHYAPGPNITGAETSHSTELHSDPELKQKTSPGDHRRVVVIHRLRFPRFLKRRRLGMPFRKV